MTDVNLFSAVFFSAAVLTFVIYNHCQYLKARTLPHSISWTNTSHSSMTKRCIKLCLYSVLREVAGSFAAAFLEGRSPEMTVITILKRIRTNA